MPRPMRATRKQQPVEKKAPAIKGQKAEEVKKEKGKKVTAKSQPPPAPPALSRTTRSQTVVEVVIETSQPTPSATATATASRGKKASTPAPPSTPKRPTRSAAATKPAPTAAPRTPSPKKPTATKAVPTAVARTPSPKKSAAGLVKARKAVPPVPVKMRVSSTSPSVEVSRLSPEILVPASSDAENRTPLSSHYASSPPAITPTTPVRRRRVVLEFTADAGYTPPRARPGSSERPRLRELGPETLEPLDTLPDDFDDEFEGPPPPSPTPKRVSMWRYSESSRHALPIDDEDAPTSAQPERRVGSPTYLQKGKAPAIPVPASEDDVFTIYSDPRSPSPALPSTSNIRELEEVVRPPISSSEPTSPQKGKKRRSSGVVVDSDEDVLQVQVAAPAPNTRGGKRRKQQQLEKLKSMKTDELRDLLPRRRRRAAEKDEFDITTTTPSPESSSDELSMPKRSRQGDKKKKPPPPPHPAKKGKPSAEVTKSVWSRPLVPAGVSKKYGRKSTGSEKENQSPNRQRKTPAVGNLTDEEGSSSSATTIADGALRKEGRKKLRLVAEKFKEVDQWEMEFEDVSLVTESSLENAR